MQLQIRVTAVAGSRYYITGLHLGSILASVSPAIVVPTVMRLSARGLGAKNQIANLVANAGGLDTAFTEGVCGVINSAIFFQSTPVYRIIKVIVNPNTFLFMY